MKDLKKILDGTNSEDIFSLVEQYFVQILLFYCNEVSKNIITIKDIHHFWDGMWGLYPNLGVEDYSNDYFNIISNAIFFLGIKNILKFNPHAAGSCCGSSPTYI